MWGLGAPWWQDGGRRNSAFRVLPAAPKGFRSPMALDGPLCLTVLWECVQCLEMGASGLFLPGALWGNPAIYSPTSGTGLQG